MVTSERGRGAVPRFADSASHHLLLLMLKSLCPYNPEVEGHKEE